MASAVRINQYTNLTATGSNTTLTFDFTFIDADEIGVYNTNITINGITCGNDESSPSDIFLITIDSTTDIQTYCGATGDGDGDTGGGGGGGSGNSDFWTGGTFAEDDKPFEEIGLIEKTLKKRQRIRLNVSGETHHIGIIELTDLNVTINVSSKPQQKILIIGESGIFEVNNDNFYDLSVTLLNITGGYASILISSIHEKISDAEPSDTNSEDDEGLGKIIGERDTRVVGSAYGFVKDYWYLFVGGFIVLVIVIFLIVRHEKNKPPHLRRKFN